MQLELKHLASYLPHDLKVLDTSKEDCIFDLNEWLFREKQFVRPFFKNHLEQILNDDSLKPILFPLSSLTKEITINGESFVPVDIICPKEDYKKEFDRKVAIGSIELQGAINFSCTAFCIVEKLFEWKFDVFGLIEAGLAEPVTEDFNPYK